MIAIVSIQKGKFALDVDGKKIGTSDLTAKGLASLYVKGAFDPFDDNNSVMCSSSIDFPECDGGPMGLDCRKLVQEGAYEYLQQSAPEPPKNGERPSHKALLHMALKARIEAQTRGVSGEDVLNAGIDAVFQAGVDWARADTLQRGDR